MSRDVFDLHELDQTQIAVAGGKGAHLGELSRIDGVRVPRGFCITTLVFERLVQSNPAVVEQLDALSRLTTDDRDAIREVSGRLRETIASISLPNDLTTAIGEALEHLGDAKVYAVRSSATAEDLPNASFAGQQDTYLNIVGTAEVLRHVTRCWASLFNERAVTYRVHNAVDHRAVRMAVIVQEMVSPLASGVLFTADPVSGNRNVSVVEAIYGLGEALVAGLSNADRFKVRDGRILDREIVSKTIAVTASPLGGTTQKAVTSTQQQAPALSDTQVLQLTTLGRRIEAHFGRPQDIEWCFADDDFFIVQSRPITTLFPIPQVNDGANHVYISTGHQQMMTDAMKPLGISFWQHTAMTPMLTAGGRLFVDATRLLASPPTRAALFKMMGRSDTLIGDALQTIVDRGDFLPPPPNDPPAPSRAIVIPRDEVPLETNSAIVHDFVARNEASIEVLKLEIKDKTGLELLEFILNDLKELQRFLFDPRSTQTFMTAIEASWWLNDNIYQWLGEKNVADTLTLSVDNNITSEMGLALLDVADAIRPHRAVIEYLEQVKDDNFLDVLPNFPGGVEARNAIYGWLAKFGMRGAGEIDISRPRWSEAPLTLIPLILGNIASVAVGAGKQRFKEGQEKAMQKEQELLARLLLLPDGEEKAGATKNMIDRLRTFMGYREYPKYGKIRRYSIYRTALLEESARLVASGALRDIDDIFYLTLPELVDVVRTRSADAELIRERRAEFQAHERLTPPRVLTSEGEAITGAYRRTDVPTGALVGLSVSTGVVEGRARIVMHPSDARLEAGDILVTKFTDPSWTPLFVGIRGLITEVGGLMSHGAVIVREYGLPALVGVLHATELIPDRSRIRLNATEGYVEILT